MRRRFVCLAIVAMSAVSVAAQSNAVPFVSQPLVPASIAPGSSTFTLTVNGTGFAPGAVVNWNGSQRLTEVISGSQLKATIDAADVAHAQTGWVTVTNPAPGGGTSNLMFLPVTRPTSSIGMAVSQPFTGALAVVAGDFNNDGKLDVGWYDGTYFNVSLGNGAGGFGAPIRTTLPHGFGSAIVTADFNGDGKLDVAGADGIGDVVGLYGNGDGTFTVGWEYVIAFGGGNYLTAADFFRSGATELYHMQYDLGSQWFEFMAGASQGQPYYTSYFPGTAVVGDFNGDGWLDLAVLENDEGPTDIWLGSASGFTELGTTDASGLVADMNQDGKLDMVSPCIYLGAGNGTFNVKSCPTNPGFAAGVGDFNGDGKLDTAMDETSPAGVGIALGNGDGTYGSTFAFSFGTAAPGLGAVGDFNNDGRLDFVTANGYLLIQTTVTLFPLSMAFGDQNVGTKSSPLKTTLTNLGASALDITKITITGTNSSQFTETNNCGSSLAAGSSCVIQVTFEPTKGGSLTADLTVRYAGTGSPQSVQLSGTGVTPPTVTLLPTSLAFATQQVGTSSGAQAATLANTGDQVVTISSIATTGAFSQTNNCGSSLSLYSSCQIQVVFTPTVAGKVSGTVSVTDNALRSPQKVALSGTGTVITISPQSINFGDQKVGTTSSPAPVTVTNNGSAGVTVTLINITGTNAEDFAQTNNCGSKIAAHSSCTVNVTFKPTATGTRSASVSITDNGGGSPQTVPLSGTGT